MSSECAVLPDRIGMQHPNVGNCLHFEPELPIAHAASKAGIGARQRKEIRLGSALSSVGVAARKRRTLSPVNFRRAITQESRACRGEFGVRVSIGNPFLTVIWDEPELSPFAQCPPFRKCEP